MLAFVYWVGTGVAVLPALLVLISNRAPLVEMNVRPDVVWIAFYAFGKPVNCATVVVAAVAPALTPIRVAATSAGQVPW